jgi:hypothetical protein
MTSSTVEPFWGDGREGENAQDFMRAFLRDTRGDDDKTKLESFENYLHASSPADEWLEDLDRADKATWAKLKEAFIKKWPKVKQAKKTQAEREDELLELRLKEEDLGKKTEVGGLDVWTHINWADKALRLAVAANVETSTTYINQVRKQLPDLIKQKVGSTHADWEAFTKAIREVDLEHIKDGAERLRKAAEEKSELRRRIRQLEASPTAGIRTQLSRAMLTAQHAPSAQPARFNDTHSAKSSTGDPFATTGGGRGNIQWGYQPQRAAAVTRTPATPAEKDAIRKRMKELTHHPNTPQGLIAYQNQVRQWIEKYGNDTRVDANSPFPLTPGTAAICSGECYRCGTHGHRGPECPLPRNQGLPLREGAWRAICGTVLGHINRETAIPIQLVAIDDATDGWEKETQDRGEQGKEEGPSA